MYPLPPAKNLIQEVDQREREEVDWIERQRIMYARREMVCSGYLFLCKRLSGSTFYFRLKLKPHSLVNRRRSVGFINPPNLFLD